MADLQLDGGGFSADFDFGDFNADFDFGDFNADFDLGDFNAVTWDGVDINFGVENFNVDENLFPTALAIEDMFNSKTIGFPTNGITTLDNAFSPPQEPTNQATNSASVGQSLELLQSTPTGSSLDHNLPSGLAGEICVSVTPAPAPYEYVNPKILNENGLDKSPASTPADTQSADMESQYFYASPADACNALNLMNEAIKTGSQAFNPGHYRRLTNDSFFGLDDPALPTASTGHSSAPTPMQSSMPSAPSTSKTTPASMKSDLDYTVSPELVFDVDNTLFPDDFNFSGTSKTADAVTSTPPSPFSASKPTRSSPLSDFSNTGVTTADPRAPRTQDLAGLGTPSGDHNVMATQGLPVNNTLWKSPTVDPQAPQFPDFSLFDDEALTAGKLVPKKLPTRDENHQVSSSIAPTNNDMVTNNFGFSYTNENEMAVTNNGISPLQGSGRAAQSPMPNFNLAVKRKSRNKFAEKINRLQENSSCGESKVRPVHCQKSNMSMQTLSSYNEGFSKIREGPAFASEQDDSRYPRTTQGHVMLPQFIQHHENMQPRFMQPPHDHQQIGLMQKGYALTQPTPTFAPTEGPQGYGVLPTRPEIIDLTGPDSPIAMHIPIGRPPTRAAQMAKAGAGRVAATGKTSTSKRSPKTSPGSFKNTTRISKPAASPQSQKKYPRFWSIPRERMAAIIASAQMYNGFMRCKDGTYAKLHIDESGNGKLEFGFFVLPKQAETT